MATAGQMSRCKNAGKYKGIRAPKCGCGTCKQKYAVEQIRKTFADGQYDKTAAWVKRLLEV